MARVLALAAAAAALVVGAALAQARETARPLPGLPAYTAGYGLPRAGEGDRLRIHSTLDQADALLHQRRFLVRYQWRPK